LTFRDDGKGMSPIELHKMLSFGHCDKAPSPPPPPPRERSEFREAGGVVGGVGVGIITQDQFVSQHGQTMPIGHYGNGFKSGAQSSSKTIGDPPDSCLPL